MQNSKCSIYVIEARFGSQWQTLSRNSSKGMAQLSARLLARKYPLHAIRVCETVIGWF